MTDTVRVSSVLVIGFIGNVKWIFNNIRYYWRFTYWWNNALSLNRINDTAVSINIIIIMIESFRKI
ncbi:MAG: hypothetical protein LC122_02805 [Chitinophagales bacterium]|nr:hypothetical protein [Chitinophagales bacterium]